MSIIDGFAQFAIAMVLCAGAIVVYFGAVFAAFREGVGME